MNEEKQTFVERHARQRLHTVEKERRKAYNKKSQEPHQVNWMQVIVQVLMIIVLATMILSIL